MRSSAAVSGSASTRRGRAAVRLRGAHLEGRGDQLLDERIRPHLRRVLDQVAGHLGCGRDDRVEEAPVAGCAGGHRPGCRRPWGRRARSRRRPGVSGAPARAAASARPATATAGVPARRGGRRRRARSWPAAGRGGRRAARWPARRGSAGRRATGAAAPPAHRPAPAAPTLVPARTRRAASTRGQRLADLPAGGPDPGPVEQRQELEDGPPPLRYRQRLLGEPLGGVEVPPLQREAGQHAQVIHGEEMLVESQPPGLRIGGPGGVGGLGQAAGLEPGQRPRTGHQHQPGRFGELGHRQGRGGLALNRLEVFQARDRRAAGSAGRRRSTRR